MKTAVNWLVDHLYLVIPNEERNFLEGMRKEALEKEKEQILRAFELGMHECLAYDANSIKYYNQTYNQQEDKTFKQKSKWTEVDNMTRRLK